MGRLSWPPGTGKGAPGPCACRVNSVAPPRPRAWPSALLPSRHGLTSRRRAGFQEDGAKGSLGQPELATGQLGCNSKHTSCSPGRLCCTSQPPTALEEGGGASKDLSCQD
jgi:hypothetical protein